jgi:hypothetical protein
MAAAIAIFGVLQPKNEKKGDSNYRCLSWCVATKKQKKKGMTTMLLSPSLVRCKQETKKEGDSNC